MAPMPRSRSNWVLERRPASTVNPRRLVLPAGKLERPHSTRVQQVHIARDRVLRVIVVRRDAQQLHGLSHCRVAEQRVRLGSKVGWPGQLKRLRAERLVKDFGELERA